MSRLRAITYFLLKNNVRSTDQINYFILEYSKIFFEITKGSKMHKTQVHMKNKFSFELENITHKYINIIHIILYLLVCDNLF